MSEVNLSLFMSTGERITACIFGGILIGVGIFACVKGVKRMADTFPQGGGGSGSRLATVAFALIGLLLASAGGALLLMGILN
jgi:hypothetical protein